MERINYKHGPVYNHFDVSISSRINMLYSLGFAVWSAALQANKFVG